MLTAELLSTTYFQGHVTGTSKGKIYLSASRIRFEPVADEDSEGYNELFLYDFKQKAMRRVFPDDRIYFEIALSERSRFKAMRDGWIPWEDSPEVKRRWIRLKEDFMNGHPCTLELLERTMQVPAGKKGKTRRLSDYSLYWKAQDLNNQPVRIVYFLPSQSVVIVDYRDARWETADPKLFRPPEGFLSLSPF